MKRLLFVIKKICQDCEESFIIVSNQDGNCHATSISFHGSSVQMKDVMNEKNDGHYLEIVVLVDRIRII